MQAYCTQRGVVQLHVQGEGAQESLAGGRGAIQGSKVAGFANIQSPAIWAKHALKYLIRVAPQKVRSG